MDRWTWMDMNGHGWIWMDMDMTWMRHDKLDIWRKIKKKKKVCQVGQPNDSGR